MCVVVASNPLETKQVWLKEIQVYNLRSKVLIVFEYHLMMGRLGGRCMWESFEAFALMIGGGL